MSPTNRHATALQRHRGPRVALATVIAVVLFAGTAAATVYREMQGGIDREDIGDIIGTDRPDSGEESPDPTDDLAGKPVNILLMGTDYRGGDNTGFGDVAGMRSDTTMLAHIAADRSRVDVVSVPRDLIADIPSCQLPDGSTTGGTQERFNAAFAFGGQGDDMAYAAACTIKTFEQMTDIYVDDWAVVDMAGFAKMVDAIGGVDMCFEEDLNDPKADLEIAAGCHTLEGSDALALARARKGIGDGSDIGRIDRQQELLTAIADQALSAQTLANPQKLLKFLKAATSSLTASERIGDLNTLVGLGYSLRDIRTDDITFATVPFDWAGNVVTQNAAGTQVWEAIGADEPIEELVASDEPNAAEGITSGSSSQDDTESDGAQSGGTESGGTESDTAEPDAG